MSEITRKWFLMAATIFATAACVSPYGLVFSLFRPPGLPLLAVIGIAAFVVTLATRALVASAVANGGVAAFWRWILIIFIAGVPAVALLGLVGGRPALAELFLALVSFLLMIMEWPEGAPSTRIRVRRIRREADWDYTPEPPPVPPRAAPPTFIPIKPSNNGR
jgi:hypothetical protein